MLLVIVLGTVVLCSLAYRFYGRALEKWSGVDAAIETPATTQADGVDYVAARPSVLFGHHFSSIAGAGPIVGPIIAASVFGWGAAWIWILFGAIFIGGVHDFGSTVMSLRTKGRSIIETCRGIVGEGTGKLFLAFAIVALVYVIVVFLDLTASGFVSNSAVATSSGWFVLTALAFGWVMRARKLPFGPAAALFIALTYLGVFVGQWLPVEGFGKSMWLAIVLAYCGIAATLPVNWLMQPRDFLSATFLYAIMALGLLGLFLTDASMKLPAFTTFAPENFGTLVPFLFITVACGACSGFHSMVASGTTSKQIASESHVRPVAYGAMLVEGVLAALALACVGVLGGLDGKSPVVAFSQGAAVFMGSLGIPDEAGATFALLAISTFLLTTLDTCTRLCRFLLEELLKTPKTRVYRGALTLGVLVVSGVFAFQTYTQNPGTPDETVLPAWRAIWPLFGSTNQLLAALALVTFLVYQRSRRLKWAFVLIPAIVMTVMPMLALVLMAFDGSQPTFLRYMALALFGLGFGVVFMSVRTFATPLPAATETA